MKVSVNRIDTNFLLEAENEEGRKIVMDAAEKIGGSNKGVRPMQVMLMALGGCSAFDIIHILRKQRQELEDIKIDVDGEREEVKDGAAVFKKIHVNFRLYGKIDSDKANKAVDLSVTKYCSVVKTLEHTATISYSVFLNDTLINEI